MIYYIIYYFAIKGQSMKKYVWVLGIYILIYISIYIKCLDLSTFCVELEGFSLFKVLFYFGPFFTGGVIQRIKYKNKNVEKSKKGVWIYLFGAGIGLLIWAMEYIRILMYNEGYKYQFLIHLGIYIFGVNILLVMLNVPKGQIHLDNRILQCIIFIGESTLPIYLMQVSFKPLCIALSYPLNFIVFWLMALMGGCIYTIGKNMINRITNKK